MNEFFIGFFTVLFQDIHPGRVITGVVFGAVAAIILISFAVPLLVALPIAFLLGSILSGLGR